METERGGALELELKLEADPADLAALADADCLSGAPFVASEQVSTYYDSPDHALRDAGLSLRVRRIGERRVQTVKAESAAAAGLFARPEWECELDGDAPALDAAASPIATLVDAATLGAVAPVFVTRIARRTARIAHAGGDVELVLDQGEIVADGRTMPVAEAELELKAGPPAALFSLARAMDAAVPLRLGVLAKSERGYRLAAGKPDRVAKSGAGVLAGGITAAQAFRTIAGACVRQFRLNEPILLRTQAPEALHQARVALRRLRSAVSIFGPMLADGRLDHVRGELRWLAATLGEARDLDVLIARGTRGERVAAARHDAYAAVLAALGSGRARALMLDLTEWAAIGGWSADPALAPLRDRPADRFAADALDRLRRRVKRRGGDLARGDDARHRLRIEAKKLRYAAEFFAGLFGGRKAARRAKAFLGTLQTLQTQLGDLNDIATAPLLLARLGIAPPPDVAAAGRKALLADAAEAHEALVDAKRFWR